MNRFAYVFSGGKSNYTVLGSKVIFVRRRVYAQLRSPIFASGNRYIRFKANIALKVAFLHHSELTGILTGAIGQATH